MVNQSTFSPAAQAQIDRLTRQVKDLQNQIRSGGENIIKDWYRPAEVCKILGISRSKFESLKRSGAFCAQKVGGVVYIAASELTAYLPKAGR
ncbi:Helix-turn-helix domain-containing protein [Dyadobacter koreensis]|uniref:Helix-turn-helix domain-containing protein n=1 Tax=Dyadobacter koreensis TaxID=408657 RepID=A0A1H7B001_9BACT|nr:helix-turn-helix domain-containing protein [Dyadobacter koreensis]SEJ71143.1 Helix-turn-helix domain-containing protein [Dyadobacter koreensis]